MDVALPQLTSVVLLRKGVIMKKVFVLVTAMVFCLASFAKMPDLKNFKTAYPNAKNIAKCTVCHDDLATHTLNPYGQDYKAAGNTFTPALAELDSDKDGFKNIVEINADTFPGDINSHPSVNSLEYDNQ